MTRGLWNSDYHLPVIISSVLFKYANILLLFLGHCYTTARLYERAKRRVLYSTPAERRLRGVMNPDVDALPLSPHLLYQFANVS